MSIFTPDEIEYLESGLLGRLATVGPDGTPHIAPVGMISYNPHLDAMDIRGHDLTKTKKYATLRAPGVPPSSWTISPPRIRGDHGVSRSAGAPRPSRSRNP